MSELEKKVDRLIQLLADQELASYHASCSGNKTMARDLILNTILASIVGYFMFRIMDVHFRPKK